MNDICSPTPEAHLISNFPFYNRAAQWVSGPLPLPPLPKPWKGSSSGQDKDPLTEGNWLSKGGVPASTPLAESHPFPFSKKLLSGLEKKDSFSRVWGFIW